MIFFGDMTQFLIINKVKTFILVYKNLDDIG